MEEFNMAQAMMLADQVHDICDAASEEKGEPSEEAILQLGIGRLKLAYLGRGIWAACFAISTHDRRMPLTLDGVDTGATMMLPWYEERVIDQIVTGVHKDSAAEAICYAAGRALELIRKWVDKDIQGN